MIPESVVNEWARETGAVRRQRQVRLLKMLLSRAFELLAAAVRPIRDVRFSLRDPTRFLLHEAVDPGAGRHGRLVSVEQRTHRVHPMAAAA